jgi:uncharacterized protein YfaS (alpha-2-macroglobulin family)
MLEALRRFVAGRLVRGSALPTADLAIRKLAAVEALSRYGAADAAMLDSIPIEPNLWPTSALQDWLGVLARVPGIPDGAGRARAAEQIVRSRLNFQGTTMGFSTERSDALWWLMVSGDSNANRLVLTMLGRAGWREDMPRVVRGALARQRRGHWNTTVANAWGVLAMEKFSAAFESTPVGGVTNVAYGAKRESVAWPRKDPASLALPWAEGPGSLEVAHAGAGQPWLMVRATAALPLRAPLSTGFRVQRTVEPLEQRTPGRWSRGDVARVRLQLEAQADATWVVVSDPVPAGASVLGSGLGGQSQLVQRGAKREGWAWTAFEERRFEGYRAYYRYVPKGTWTVEYTVRFDNPGTFVLPPTRVEAMYAPEMLGEVPNGAVSIEPAP